MAWLVYFAKWTGGVEHCSLPVLSRTPAIVCECVCDQQACIIDEWISICIYLGKKCYESIKWLAAHLVCSSRLVSNWLLRVFVWDSVGDSHTLQDTWWSIKHVWSNFSSLWETRSEASGLNLWKPHTTKQLGKIIINWLSPLLKKKSWKDKKIKKNQFNLTETFSFTWFSSGFKTNN